MTLNLDVSLAHEFRLAGEALTRASELMAKMPGSAPDQQMTQTDSLFSFDPSRTKPIDPATDPAQGRAPITMKDHPGRLGIRIEDAIERPIQPTNDGIYLEDYEDEVSPPVSDPTHLPMPTKDEVSTICRTLCKQGLVDEVKSILAHYDATSVSSLDAKHYLNAMAELKAISTNPTNPNDHKEAT